MSSFVTLSTSLFQTHVQIVGDFGWGWCLPTDSLWMCCMVGIHMIGIVAWWPLAAIWLQVNVTLPQRSFTGAAHLCTTGVLFDGISLVLRQIYARNFNGMPRNHGFPHGFSSVTKWRLKVTLLRFKRVKPSKLIKTNRNIKTDKKPTEITKLLKKTNRKIKTDKKLKF